MILFNATKKLQLKENYKFSTRCVKRIELISSEIVTDDELKQLEAEADAAEAKAVADAIAAGTKAATDGAPADQVVS